MNRYSLLGLLLVTLSFPVLAEMLLYEEAVEVLELDVAISKDGNGYVAGRQCPSCTLRRFTVEPTVSFYWDGVKRPLEDVNRKRSLPVTLFYEAENKKLTRIEGYGK